MMERLNAAKKPIFYCSFGKDSSAVLHMIRPWLHKTLVAFIDCGGMYPDIVQWADIVGKTLPHFIHYNAPGNIWDDIKHKGWMVDAEFTALGRYGKILHADPLAKDHKLRSWAECVAERFWVPAAKLATFYNADLMISGERSDDRPFADDWEIRNNGMNVIRPIFGWTDDDVWNYLDKHEISLPKTYQGRQKDRMDCFPCFGHNMSADRIRYMKKEYPDLYEKIFVEKGFRDVVPRIVHYSRQMADTWSEIQDIIGE